jgi:hypothetical protein
MHKLTDNNEVSLRPFDGRWEAFLTFYSLNGERNVKVRAVSHSPDTALAKLWSFAEELGYW